ncbi:Uncharacterized protein Fot_06312 [Forsythia ovata]|uniref:Uncharacterized protein n=1 Tax=Forsythia ovata TaxID=205694 RepID=A0ABD1WVL9_9LAMI
MGREWQPADNNGALSLAKWVAREMGTSRRRAAGGQQWGAECREMGTSRRRAAGGQQWGAETKWVSRNGELAKKVSRLLFCEGQSRRRLRSGRLATILGKMGVERR